MEKYEAIDKLQRQDHDTLLRLEGKVDSLILNLATLQTGIDLRIKTLETECHANSQWIHDFRLTYRIVLAIASGVSASVTFLLSVLFKYL